MNRFEQSSIGEEEKRRRRAASYLMSGIISIIFFGLCATYFIAWLIGHIWMVLKP